MGADEEDRIQNTEDRMRNRQSVFAALRRDRRSMNFMNPAIVMAGLNTENEPPAQVWGLNKF
jgi:hypothetical protein